jgi:catechol 2,3-dioxygenase-like lactoylglutathione lyase family enzyme
MLDIKMVSIKLKFFLFVLLMVPQFIFSQEIAIQRPAIWGIAKMTFLVNNYQVARDYYGRFLGFDEAFSYPSDLGKVISFKVNDRQYIEFVVVTQAKDKKRLVSVSFETESVDQMRKYLKSQGLNVPDKTIIDGAGNEVFVVDDPSGNHIEFINYKANGLHHKSNGRFLSKRRISKRIHHAGLYAETITDNNPFYVGILKFKEMVRYPEDKSLAPTILYLSMGDCIENIEQYSPNDQNFCHPCFLVDDMQETIYTLKERRVNEKMDKPVIGNGRRWLLNLRNSDQTKVEFTEAYCVR